MSAVPGQSLPPSTANAAIVPGVNFIHYHSATTNSDLYIADTLLGPSPGPPNNPPTIFLDGAPDGLNLPDGLNHAVSYITGDAAGVAISDVDATIDDPDPTDTSGISAHILSLDAQIIDPHSGALEYLDLTAAGHTIATSNGLAITGENTSSLHIGGSASDAVYQSLLREIRYVNTDMGSSLDTSDRHTAVSVSDGVDTSNVPITTIAITGGSGGYMDGTATNILDQLGECNLPPVIDRAIDEIVLLPQLWGHDLILL